MTSRPRKQVEAQKALREFVGWVGAGMDQSIRNCLELKSAIPANLANPILRFVIPRTREHVAQRLVLDAVEAWDLLNAELKRQGLRPLGTSDRDYRHLKRIRNKLVAHGAENLVKTSRHKTWYQRNYDYERMLSLVRRVAQGISTKVEDLTNQGRIARRRVTTTKVPQFGRQDVEALLDAIRAHGIY
jgi:hypothetical protein